MTYFFAIIVLSFIGYFLIRFDLSKKNQKRLLSSLGVIFILYIVLVVITELFR